MLSLRASAIKLKINKQIQNTSWNLSHLSSKMLDLQFSYCLHQIEAIIFLSLKTCTLLCEIQNLLRINILTCVAIRKLLFWWYSAQLVPLLGCISLTLHDFNEKVHYVSSKYIKKIIKAKDSVAGANSSEQRTIYFSNQIPTHTNTTKLLSSKLRLDSVLSIFFLLHLQSWKNSYPYSL